jgi:hypothetical protein
MQLKRTPGVNTAQATSLPMISDAVKVLPIAKHLPPLFIMTINVNRKKLPKSEFPLIILLPIYGIPTMMTMKNLMDMMLMIMLLTMNMKI